jgi:hypothetical protein
MTFVRGGNIGVGTTAPAYKLDIVGTTHIGGALYDGAASAGTAGSVLTSTGTATQWVNNAVGFSAYANTSTTIAASTATKITFDAESYDDANAFASNGYTAPVAGVYHFDAGVRFPAAASDAQYMWISFYVNGGLVKDVATQTSTAQYGANISADLKLAAGDIVTVYVYSTPATSTSTGSFNCWFNGHKIY